MQWLPPISAPPNPLPTAGPDPGRLPYEQRGERKAPGAGRYCSCGSCGGKLPRAPGQTLADSAPPRAAGWAEARCGQKRGAEQGQRGARRSPSPDRRAGAAAPPRLPPLVLQLPPPPRPQPLPHRPPPPLLPTPPPPPSLPSRAPARRPPVLVFVALARPLTFWPYLCWPLALLLALGPQGVKIPAVS